MSRIDDLLQQLCPKGVPSYAIEDVGVTISGLTGKTKSDFSGGNARYISYKNVFENIAVDQDREDFVRIGDGERQHQLRLGDVLITGSSESLDEVGMSSVVTVDPKGPLYLNSFCFAVRMLDPELLDPNFSKYLFRSELMRKAIRGVASGVTRFNISKARFTKIRFPVPPIEVQREIVRILDQFTQLEAELEAELELRRAQYNHYRDQLLNFDENSSLSLSLSLSLSEESPVGDLG